jgi:serine/threonine protein kinase
MMDWFLSKFGRDDSVRQLTPKTQSPISKVIWDWPTDEPFRVEKAIEENPELADDPRALIEFAVEEFADRRDSGEEVSASTYAQRFPAVQTQLFDSLVVDQGFRENSDWVQDILSRKPDQYDWPGIGETIGGYKLLEPLGAGGFSRVYLADDPKVPGRNVALKLCRQETHEATNLANLNHRSIGVVYDVTRDNKRGFGIISMQFRSRTTIHNIVTKLWGGRSPESAKAVWDVVQTANRLEGETPEWSQATFTDWVLNLAIELARGLAESHENGIVHCDLKPANILVDREGRPILVDFNVAFRRDAAASPGNVGGTLPYMAPEQIRAIAGHGCNELAPPTDLYGLGATLYELLTGQLPFGAVQSAEDGIRALLTVRKTRPRAIRRRNPGIDIEFERLILDCMSYDSATRPQTAGELADALERIRTRRMVDAAELGRRRMTRWGSAAAVATLGAIIGLGIIEERPTSAPAVEIQKTYEDELTDAYALLDKEDWHQAADRFAKVVEADKDNRAAIVGLYRAKAQLRISQGGASEIEGLINGNMTPRLASFVGYLRTLNDQCDQAIPLLRYSRRTGLNDEALLVNLAFALRQTGEFDEAAAILDEVRQRFGDREKANLLLVSVIQRRDKGGISIDEANRLTDPIPPSGSRSRMLSSVYFNAGIMARRRDAELSQQCMAKSAQMLVEACRLGADLRHWNNLRRSLPQKIQDAHAEFFKGAGAEPAFPDNREFTIDPLAGLQLQQIIEVAADQVQKPIVVAGR